MSQNYPRLDIVTFGKHLFESQDLDPVYVALQKCKLQEPQLARWLVSYWCFYNSGFASWASEAEGDVFWLRMTQAAQNRIEAPVGGRWPRGAERRHFRGETAESCIRALRHRYKASPERMVRFLLDGPMDVRSVIERAKTHPFFGPWISFKIADMLDVFCHKVEQDDLSVFLYDTPRKSIEEHLQKGLSTGLVEVLIPKEDAEARQEYAMSWLWMQLKELRIPHKPKSAPDWFSLETVWCKHLSHMHGHYPLFKDIVEITEGVEPWTKVSLTAGAFRKGLPVHPQEPCLW